MWVMTVHGGGGSTVEICDVEFATGFISEAQADNVGSALVDVMNQIDKYGDYWHQVFEVHMASKLDWPLASAEQRAKENLPDPQPGEVAIDLWATAKLILGEDDELGTGIPLLVETSDDDVAAAIASITGGAP